MTEAVGGWTISATCVAYTSDDARDNGDYLNFKPDLGAKEAVKEPVPDMGKYVIENLLRFRTAHGEYASLNARVQHLRETKAKQINKETAKVNKERSTILWIFYAIIYLWREKQFDSCTNQGRSIEAQEDGIKNYFSGLQTAAAAEEADAEGGEPAAGAASATAADLAEAAERARIEELADGLQRLPSDRKDPNSNLKVAKRLKKIFKWIFPEAVKNVGADRRLTAEAVEVYGYKKCNSYQLIQSEWRKLTGEEIPEIYLRYLDGILKGEVGL